jgi:hypothetical protein
MSGTQTFKHTFSMWHFYLDIHWFKKLPFLSGLKTKVCLHRPNFIRTKNILLGGLSGVLLLKGNVTQKITV